MKFHGLKQIQSQLQKAPQAVKLVAVTKYFDLKTTQALIGAGVTSIGENCVEAAEQKFPHLPSVEKHFIGRIQSKKIKKIVQLFDVIQSVGCNEHLIKIEKEASHQNKKMSIFLQFNISEEPQKSGYRLDSLEEIHVILNQIQFVEVSGLMGMASQTDDRNLIRGQFKQLREIRVQLKKSHPHITQLSMGMSNDYSVAIEEGATLVRIGSGLI